MLCFSVDCLLAALWWNSAEVIQFHPNPANRQLNEKHNTYQCCIYSIQYTCWWWLQICPKHVEVDWRNKLRINGPSNWSSLHRCIEMHGQQNIKCIFIYLFIYLFICYWLLNTTGMTHPKITSQYKRYSKGTSFLTDRGPFRMLPGFIVWPWNMQDLTIMNEWPPRKDFKNWTFALFYLFL